MGYFVDINEDKCRGCGKCVRICPKSLIELVDEKARVEQPYLCDGLKGCMKRCPENAITITPTLG